MFTDKALKKLIIPLIIEQLLAVAMGMIDTMMVASCGEAAVSGISIVDTIGVLLIGLFGAMASGGAVVAAQYIGRGEKEKVARASNQLFLAVGGVALFLMAAALLFNRQLLQLIYGQIDADVMGNARVYFYFTALSYPFLGIYNGGAALFRAVGNSRVSMITSIIVNVMNVAGNALFIFGFHMGVAGAGLSTLLSRITATIIVCWMLKKKGDVPVRFQLRLDWGIMRRILYIGVPNGLENSIFQLGKLLLSSLIAGFGTVAIAANAVAGNICSFETIPSGAIGISMITVVGQCVGAGQYDQVKVYVRKLMTKAYIYVAALSIAIILGSRIICGWYQLGEDTMELAVRLIVYHSICCMVLHPSSFALANGLRAANDVKFTMVVAICSMWICRIILAYVLARGMELGVLGVWIAMTIDWLVRSIFFVVRMAGGKWKKYAAVN